MREKYPDIHLRLGNGPLPTKEAFLERGFSADLFDSTGNESAVFGRPPEAQPPEWVGNNSGIWMDRQMLDHYGHSDKPVTQCFETCYPSSNPGNLSYRTQADFFARHYLHAMAWELPLIRYGIIMDVGNSYFYGNWGSGGFCFQMPDVSVKPAYVSIATLTRVLDGAKFQESIDLGTNSLFALHFDRPDGKTVYAIWSPDNTYTTTWSASSGAGWSLVDSQGNSTNTASNGNVLAIVDGSPRYLVGEGRLTFEAAELHIAPVLNQSIQTDAVVDMGSLDGWKVSQERDLELETHNGLTPRRKGDFAFEPVEAFADRTGVLRVTPKPTTNGTKYMPMYSVLEHKTGIELPGKPTEIGMWVNGNASWGRIIYELIDAKGERFLSIGASKSGGASTWMLDWMPEEMAEQRGDLSQADWNTNDVFGLSRFSFEGWRLVRFPLPGNFPGENFHWPYSSQWKHTDDDVVDYPLTLKRLIVELPENTLHLRDYSPANRKEVYLDNIVVIHGDDQWLAPDGPQYNRKAHGSR